MTNETQLARDLERIIGEDERTHELGVRLEVLGERLIVEGEVASEARRAHVLEVLGEHATGLLVVDHLTLSAEPMPGTPEHEQISPQ